MRVIFDEDASEDLQRIFEWIAKDDPRAARTLIQRIVEKSEGLAAPEFTYMGRPGRDPGTHELLERPYVIVYEVHESRNEIVILSVVHGARDR